MKVNPQAVLNEAMGLIGERGQDYGGIEDNFSHIASIFTTMTGKAFGAHDVAMVLAAVKIARIRQSPGKADNYLDAINYLAFAHELRPQQNSDDFIVRDPMTGLFGFARKMEKHNG